MSKSFTIILAVLLAVDLRAEIHTLTLRQAIDLALKQNPDVALARLDEMKAAQAVDAVRDPSSLHLTAGSGLAYSSGFPMSISGAAPSVFQASATRVFFNHQQKLQIAQARENVRTAGFATAAKRDEVAFRAASLFLDAERLARSAENARRQVQSLERVSETIRARVEEGRELPIEDKRAALNVARARQRAEMLEGDQAFAENSLASVLGLKPEDRVRAANDARTPPPVPATEAEAVESAIQASQELKRIESAILAKALELRAQKAGRLPRADIVAQYGLFARFNKYEDFFRRFERNNGQLGVSFQVPLFPGSALSSQAAQAETDLARLRLELDATRSKLSADTRRSYVQIREAELAREVAKLDLDVARDQLSVLLSQMEEGRASLRQIEEARFTEDEKWIAFYDAQYTAEKARLELLSRTGQLVAALH